MIASNHHGLKTKNISTVLRGRMYTHPKFESSEFINFLRTPLKKVTSENKEIYTCGDFNIDLLQPVKVNSFQLYYNSRSSFVFFLLLSNQIKVLENQLLSLTANIFCNNLPGKFNVLN